MVAVNYLWNPVNDNIVREFDDAGSVVAEYTTEPSLYGNVVSQHRGGQTSYLHSDALGSTTELTNDAGNVTDTIRYSAFGEVTQRTGTTEIPFQYVGQKGYYHDNETAESSVRRRPLFPPNERWLTIDPPQSMRDLQGRLFAYRALIVTQPYVYSQASPVRFTDPSGLAILDLSPATEVGAPWCKVGRNEPIVDSASKTVTDPDLNGLPFGTYGRTEIIKYGIACVCRCHDFVKHTYHIRCILWSYLKILISPVNMVEGNHTLTGVYGHEQLHIRNFLDSIKAQADHTVAPIEDDIHASYDACVKSAAGLVAFVKERLDEAIDREENHRTTGPFRRPLPIKGRDEPPTGKMPAKPDCKPPGQPRPAPVKQFCCEVRTRFGPYPVE